MFYGILLNYISPKILILFAPARTFLCDILNLAFLLKESIEAEWLPNNFMELAILSAYVCANL